MDAESRCLREAASVEMVVDSEDMEAEKTSQGERGSYISVEAERGEKRIDLCL